MKKSYILSAIIPVLLLSACQIEELYAPEAGELQSVTVSVPDGIGTKTFLGPDDKVYWEQGDEIAFFQGNGTGLRMQLSSGAGTTKATFTEVPRSDGAITGGTELPFDAVLYPYGGNHRTVRINMNGTIVNAIEAYLPSSQSYSPDSFASDVNLAFAMRPAGEEGEFKLYNMLGGIELQLTGTGKVDRIELTANAFDKEGCYGLYGYVYPGYNDVTDETALMYYYNDAQDPLTLDCGGVQLNESVPTSFYFMVPPQVFPEGVTFTIYDGDKKMVKSSSSALTVSRSVITPVKPFIFEGTELYSETLLGPDGKPTVVTFTQGFWQEVHAAYIKYYEKDGIRYCVTSGEWTIEGEEGGFWGVGDSGNHLFFNWYLDSNLIEVPVNYMGWDYQGTSPVCVADYYNYFLSGGYSLGSFFDFAEMYSETYPVSYYDGNGGFYFNLKYYVPEVGSFTTDQFELVGLCDFYVPPTPEDNTFYDIEGSTNLWRAANLSVDTWYSPADWSGGLSANYSLNAGNSYTVTLPNGIGGAEWMGQNKLISNIPTSNEKEYDFSVTLLSDRDITVTVKLTDKSDYGDVDFFYDGNVFLPAGEPVVYRQHNLVQNVSGSNLMLILDYGRGTPGTTIQAYDILFQEHKEN